MGLPSRKALRTQGVNRHLWARGTVRERKSVGESQCCKPIAQLIEELNRRQLVLVFLLICTANVKNLRAPWYESFPGYRLERFPNVVLNTEAGGAKVFLASLRLCERLS